MPNKHYAQLWLEARRDLEKLMADDKVVQEAPLIEERQVAVNIVLKLYFRYRRMVQRLTTCHDQIVQPQIRELLGKQLDYSIARMLECRQELVNLTFLDCPWPNDMLLDMKLTPEDVRLKAPAYDAAAREAEFARRRRVVEDANMQIEDDSISQVSSLQTYASEESRTAFRSRRQRGKSQMTGVVIDLASREPPEQRAARELREAQEKKEKNYRDAVVLIQSHERARVARRVAKNAILDRHFRVKLASEDLQLVEPAEQARAASMIQRCWRRFRARLRYEQRIERLEELLGMTIPSWSPRDVQRLGEQAFGERLDEQLRAAKQRDDAIEAQREKLWQVRGPALVEDIREEIRQWFLLWFGELGYFDWIPEPEDGGSLMIATGQVRTPSEYLTAPPDDKKKKPAKDPFEEEEEEEEEEPEGWKMSESRVFPLLVEANEEFAEHWSRRTERILDPRAPTIADLITEPLCHELQLEMRSLADDSMRAELAKLNQALIADGIENGTPRELPKRQAFEKPEPVAATPAKKEKPNPLADVAEDELLVELSRQEVLRDCPRERLSDWPGAVSYEIRADDEPCLGDVILPVMDYCVLPFGSKRVNELAPEVRSVCVCGPPGSGQLFIARSICAELKATVFDLTPDRHIGRFLKRSGQDRLVDAVLKLAKSYAPSVILVEDESAFLKYIPLEMRPVQPKRFAAIYRKIVKGIKPGDQILFLTASQQPYMATRSFVKLHDKFIVIPVADRGTLYRLFKYTLMSRLNVHRHVEVSSLARLCAAGQVPLELASMALELATPVERRIDLKRRPLQPGEIFERLFQLGLPKKEVDSFAKFRVKLPMEVARQEMLLMEAEQQQQQQDKKKK